jgi:Cdc6-like AAA superfamily ATPase
VNYQKALKQQQAGTGSWLLKSDQFFQWKTDLASFLWLYGIPGCGKTILSSTILQAIHESYKNDIGKVVAYFFFDFTDSKKQNSEIMVQSLISQLSQQCVKIPAPLETLFSACGKGGARPSYEAILRVLKEMILEFPQIYIILDALDECEDRKELLDTLEYIHSWNIDKLHILVTSRKERDIEKSLESLIDPSKMICLQTEVVDLDIQAYIRQRLSNDKGLEKWRKDDQIREEIEMVLMKGSHGMYAKRTTY